MTLAIRIRCDNGRFPGLLLVALAFLAAAPEPPKQGKDPAGAPEAPKEGPAGAPKVRTDYPQTYSHPSGPITLPSGPRGKV
jgi:hypothetical protein